VYKVLLVDDERIILDGITRIIDWPTLGLELLGTAQNGLQGYERIAGENPDIVVCDIRMPGMDGLELVEKTHASHPHIKFVILSGFGEFEYANRAMQYGVKHFLLKPTNERKIEDALSAIVRELDSGRDQESFVRTVKERLEKVMPHVKEQVLKEFVTNKTYGSLDWEYYRGLFRFEFNRPVRLLLFQPEGSFEYEHLFAVKNIAEDLLEETLLGTTIGGHVLILIEDIEDAAWLHERIHAIRNAFQQYYKLDLTISLSDPDLITKARKLYQETLQGLKYRFYLDEGGLITSKETGGSAESEFEDYDFDESRLAMSVRSGDGAGAERALREWFAGLKRAQFDIDMTKSYAIQQYVALFRQADPQSMGECYRTIPQLVEMSTLQAIQLCFEETVRDMAKRNYERNALKHTTIIRRIEEIVGQRLHDGDLSLNLVAREMLYMNADYLGKLFKKETGERFTHYVVKARIKRATELIAERPDIKIFELAAQLGYGDNPQYFSQVFKKQLGCTPSEYMTKHADTSAF